MVLDVTGSNPVTHPEMSWTVDSGQSERSAAIGRLPHAVHGLLNLNKPTGMTSRDAVNRVQQLLPRKTKVGHAGTLDPLANGVLIVAIGAATRLIDDVQAHGKGYRAGLRLGVRSDTDDVTGELTPGGDPSRITSATVQTALSPYVGEISQIPPRYSAVHVDGRRAYTLARRDQAFELTARRVQVESITLIEQSGADVTIDIVCGSGTYIRSIIRDLGEDLGCGAVMTSLTRTFIGPFQMADALPLADVNATTFTSHIHPLRSVLRDEACFQATETDCADLLKGRGVAWPTSLALTNRPIAVLDPTGELFAFAAWNESRQLLMPQRVFPR